jgi:hypothetical protein
VEHWTSYLCDPGNLSEIVRNRWKISLDGQGWAFATDGKIAVALPLELAMGVLPDLPEKYRAKVAEILTPQGEPSAAAFDALLAFAGPWSPVQVTCPCCGETFLWEDNDRLPGILGGAVVDRLRLARVLVNLPKAETCLYAGKPVLLVSRSPAWRVAIMPMEPSKDHDGDPAIDDVKVSALPVFPVPVPAT